MSMSKAFGSLSKLGLSKSNLMNALKLGAGAAMFPFAYGFLRSQVLLRMSPQYFAQGTWVELMTRGLSGVMMGGLGKKFLGASMGDGIVASAVGSVATELAASLMNPAAAAANSLVTATEQATGQDQMSGINPMGRGLAGLGYGGRDNSLLFGVGTPDMRANKMFNGATVAIESGGPMSGATVAIESENGFAGALS